MSVVKGNVKKVTFNLNLSYYFTENLSFNLVTQNSIIF